MDPQELTETEKSILRILADKPRKKGLESRRVAKSTRLGLEAKGLVQVFKGDVTLTDTGVDTALSLGTNWTSEKIVESRKAHSPSQRKEITAIFTEFGHLGPLIARLRGSTGTVEMPVEVLRQLVAPARRC